MDLCMHSDGRSAACTHPLPCPLHGTRIEAVSLELRDYEWLIEYMPDGAMLLTLRMGRPGLKCLQSRLCLVENGIEDIAATREYMLREAGLFPRELPVTVS